MNNRAGRYLPALNVWTLVIGYFWKLFMPLPVSDLFKILAIFSDVLFVLNKLVVHLLD